MISTKEKKRKLMLVTMTFVLCITVMIAGTFAWQSISQTALNEASGEMTNPGGRLHDDFNFDLGNKDIYVENFTSKAEEVPIIVRVRLYEYMEVGPDADGDSTNNGTDTTVYPAGAESNDKSTWHLYKHNLDAQNPDDHFGFMEWEMGGKTVYMPTFNKVTDQTDSRANISDINGKYDSVDPTSGKRYSDYTVYSTNAGDPNYSKTATEYVNKDLTTDGSGEIPGQTHQAKETNEGQVITMQDWIDGGKKCANVWVYDEDGWAYWANPLRAQEATGLLLNGIGKKLGATVSGKWYYSIYVDCQMVDAEGLGSKTDNKGFYTEAVGTSPDNVWPSENAEELLAVILDAMGGSSTSSVSVTSMESEPAFYTWDEEDDFWSQFYTEAEPAEDEVTPDDTETEETDKAESEKTDEDAENKDDVKDDDKKEPDASKDEKADVSDDTANNGTSGDGKDDTTGKNDGTVGNDGEDQKNDDADSAEDAETKNDASEPVTTTVNGTTSNAKKTK